MTYSGFIRSLISIRLTLAICKNTIDNCGTCTQFHLYTYLCNMFLLFLSFSSVLFLFLNRLLDYLKKKNIWFVASNVGTEIISKLYDPVPLVNMYHIIYNKFAGHPFGGCFQQFKPQFLIRDPDLIRRILSIDFDYFRDRGHVRFC